MRVFAFLMIILVSATQSMAQPAIEAYGTLPALRSMAISPDGKHLGYLIDKPGDNRLVIQALDRSTAFAVDTSSFKARAIEFLTNEYVVLYATTTITSAYYINDWEYGAAIVVNINDQEMTPLLRRTSGLAPGQSLSNIVGVSDDGENVFMAAWTSGTRDPNSISAIRGTNRPGPPTYSLYKVSLKTGRGRLYKAGERNTRDWIVDAQGNVLASEIYDDLKNEYRLLAEVNGRWETLFEGGGDFRAGNLIGVMPDGERLVFSKREADGYVLSTASLNGEINRLSLGSEGASIDRVLYNNNRVLEAVRYGGLLRGYRFLGSKINSAVQDMVDQFEGLSVDIDSWTPDDRYFVIRVSGSRKAPMYYLYDVENRKLVGLGGTYEEISDADVGEVVPLRYKARDGIEVPAIVTLPPTGPRKNLPMIALPHGGPESYDSVGFDWLAQYFASRGYLVLQPNFRGSSGFGSAWAEAGYGEWGRGVMQHDVTDGVKALIESGWADPDRVCIMGGSYGGFSALAGGAFTPDLYKCVAAIAPVSDVKMMLGEERGISRLRRRNAVYEYWERAVGADPDNLSKLDEISPAKNAEEFKAPVLLIHGLDDTVVPVRQSRTMERALKRADKDVTLVELEGEDHWLSTSETRLATLKALDQFIKEHIGGER